MPKTAVTSGKLLAPVHLTILRCRQVATVRWRGGPNVLPKAEVLSSFFL